VDRSWPKLNHRLWLQFKDMNLTENDNKMLNHQSWITSFSRNWITWVDQRTMIWAYQSSLGALLCFPISLFPAWVTIMWLLTVLQSCNRVQSYRIVTHTWESETRKCKRDPSSWLRRANWSTPQELITIESQEVIEVECTWAYRNFLHQSW